MTPKAFVERLAKLGYTPHNASELGIARRSAYRYPAGKSDVPEAVIRLLCMYEWHGIEPPEGKHWAR